MTKLRIHVERLNWRIKSYHLQDISLPLSVYCNAEDIIHVCAYFTQFQSPIIAKVENMSKYYDLILFTIGIYRIHFWVIPYLINHFLAIFASPNSKCYEM